MKYHSMSDKNVLKEKAQKDRQKKAAAQAAAQSYRFSDDIKFNLKPRQGCDESFLAKSVKHVLGDFGLFAKSAIHGKEAHLYLGLDNTVPGTPEVLEFDSDNPFNGFTNGINHTSQIQKLVNNVKNGRTSDFAEPKGKVNFHKHSTKQKPPRLKMNTKEVEKGVKTPNKIESILKEMTQGLPPILTDIETPGKNPSKNEFTFPKPTETQEIKNEGVALLKERSSVNSKTKAEVNKESVKALTDLSDAQRSSKSPSQVSRKLSSSSSSGDSSSGSSASSYSEDEQPEKQLEKPKTITTDISKMKLNSPLLSELPHKLRKNTSPLNNNYLLDKSTLNQNGKNAINYQNGANPALELSKVNVKSENNLLDHDTNLNLFDSVQWDSGLFTDLSFPGPGGGNFVDDILMLAKPEAEIEKDLPVEPEVTENEKTEDVFSPNSVFDNELDRSLPNPCLPRRGSLYRKDSERTDERNKSSSKSNETKDKSKSKTTRIDSFPSVKVNSGSIGHNCLTKAQLKMPLRRKSLSESSSTSTDENKSSRKSKDKSSKTSLTEKQTKKEKIKKEKPKLDTNLPEKSKNNIDTKSSTTVKTEKVKPSNETKTSLINNKAEKAKCNVEVKASTDSKKEKAKKDFIKPESSIEPVPKMSPQAITTVTSNELPISLKFEENLFPTPLDTIISPMTSPMHLPLLPADAGGVKEQFMKTGLKLPTAIMTDNLTPLLSPIKDILSPIKDIIGTRVELNEIIKEEIAIAPSLNSIGIDIRTVDQKSREFFEDINICTDMEIDDVDVNADISLGLVTLEAELPSVVFDAQPPAPVFEEKPSPVIFEEKSSPAIFEEKTVEKMPPPVLFEEKPPLTAITDESLDLIGQKQFFTQVKSEGQENTPSPRNCFEMLEKFEPPVDITNLKIKIPLHLIKLKDSTLHNYRNRTSKQSMLQRKSIALENHVSPDDTDEMVDVEAVDIPLKRKRKSSDSSCDVLHNKLLKSTEISKAELFKQPTNPTEKLIVRINLSQLKRIPTKNASISNHKKLTPSLHVETVSVKEEQVSPESIESTSIPSDVKEEPPGIMIESSEAAIISDLTVVKQKKTRGRPSKNAKAVPKADTKKLVENEVDQNVSVKSECDNNIDENVCHQCGVLRKDYGRDPKKLASYKKSYSAYWNEGRRSKHVADCLTDHVERAHTYVEAVLNYVQYLIGLETSAKLSTKQGADEFAQIMSQCIRLVDHVITRHGRKSDSSTTPYDRRFLFICLRLQSVLYLKLFNVKKESTMKYSKVLSEYYKQYKPVGTDPSPYHKPAHNRGSTGTPSPSSPSPGPSPGGSVASIGSAGSTGSAGSHDKALNGTGAYVTIPTDMHEKAFQYMQYTKYLLHAHRLWDDAELLTTHCQGFLTNLSCCAGILSMQSTMLHVVNYVKNGLRLIKESPPS